MTTIDKGASKGGHIGEVVEDNVSPREAMLHCRTGREDIGVRTTTKKGCPKEVSKLSWVTAESLLHENSTEKGEAEEDEGGVKEEGAEELPEAIIDF